MLLLLAALASEPEEPVVDASAAVTSLESSPVASEAHVAEVVSRGPDDTPVPGREIRLVRQVDPVFPAAAKREASVRTTCEVVVRINSSGIPDDVSPVGCEPEFVEPTLAAVRRWRFEADPVEGVAEPAVFRVRVEYHWQR